MQYQMDISNAVSPYRGLKMNFSQKFNKLALRAMLVLGLTASGAAHAACDVTLVSVFANGQAVLKADCGTGVLISQITWLQNNIQLPTPPLTVSTIQDIYYTTAITTGTSTFTATATGNNGVVLAGKAATIISPPAAPVCTSVSASPSSVSVGTPANVIFSANCNNTPTSYAWTATNGGPALTSTGNGSTATATFPATSTASYGYTVTATNGGGSGSASTTVQVSSVPPPSCTLSANPTAVNAGSSSTLTASCSPAATSYAWTGATCATTSSSCTVTPAATTT